ncbi:MAG: hypothetical protein AAFV28_10340 [Cyanobacteria bacterium J06635_13]
MTEIKFYLAIALAHNGSLGIVSEVGRESKSIVEILKSWMFAL